MIRVKGKTNLYKLEQLTVSKMKEEKSIQIQTNLKCLRCHSLPIKPIYYSCCFQPTCEKCYSGFHFLQCKKTIPNNHSRLQLEKYKAPSCARCKTQIKNSIFVCKHCHNAEMCKQCSDTVHKKGKFVSHFVRQVELKSKMNIFQCTDHKKVRKFLTQKGEVVCSQCVSQNKLKKVKCIGENCLQENRERIKMMISFLNDKAYEHENMWKDLKQKLRMEYEKLINSVNEKYDQNLLFLEKVSKFDSELLQQVKSKCSQAEKQAQIEPVNSEQKVLQIRLLMWVDELVKQKKIIQSTQCFSYKFNLVQFQKFENLLKNFNLQKIKIKEEEDKENRSSRKSNVSSNKVPNSNLSCSRRSVSKSVQKVDDLKASVKSIAKSYFPTESGGTSNNNSSNKKGYQRANSIVTSKIQEIEPVILNFDLKESNQNKINFHSSKTESDISRTIDTQNSISNSNLLFRQSMKRKTDFFDIRERMRKPSMINNRFNKK